MDKYKHGVDYKVSHLEHSKSLVKKQKQIQNLLLPSNDLESL